jgi:poly-gamma-glutamate synthesis protein (capsule biosynthesis protein)
MALHTHRSTPTHGHGRARIRRAAGITGIAIGGAAVVAAVGAALTGVSVSDFTNKVDSYQLTAIAPQVLVTPEPTAEVPDGPVSFTLVAAGDVLPHSAVVSSAERTGTFDMEPLWGELDPWVSGADLAICHMEVPVAPAGTDPSGFPIFSAPAELVPALKTQGWDGCSTASNHMVDKGWDGIVASLDAFSAQRMGAVGTASSAEESNQPQLYKVQAGNRYITVAHLSWSYGTNGLPVPSDKPWSVNTFNSAAADVSGIVAQAQAARDAGADVVVASIHCCVEYTTQPTAAQRALAQGIADSGLVDLVIGHHAHVPQPIEKLSGGPGGKGMWVAFGLGNYISNQDYSTVSHTETASGVLLTATFTVAVDGTVEVAAEWTGVTVDRTGGHTLHVISDIPDGVGNLSAAEVAKRYDLLRAAVGTQAPERTAPPTALADAAFWIERGPWTASTDSQRPETPEGPMWPTE